MLARPDVCAFRIGTTKNDGIKYEYIRRNTERSYVETPFISRNIICKINPQDSHLNPCHIHDGCSIGDLIRQTHAVKSRLIVIDLSGIELASNIALLIR